MTTAIDAFYSSPLSEALGRLIEPRADGCDLSVLGRESILAALSDCRVLLLRGFAADPLSFSAFTERISRRFYTYKGGAVARKVLSRDGTLLSVTAHSRGLRVPAHGEMYYKGTRPELLWFYCESPSRERGETSVWGGAEVFNDLLPETQHFLRSRGIKYTRHYPTIRWQSIYQTRNLDVVAADCAANRLELVEHEDGSITTEFASSALARDPLSGEMIFINNILPITQQEELGLTFGSVRLDDGRLIPSSVLLDVETVIERNALHIAWKKGDILIVDNRRALHGRRAFSRPAERKIYVRMSDVE